MKRKYLFSIAALISLLVILIPVALAAEIDTYDNLVLKTAEQKIILYDSPGNQSSALSDPGKACISQHEETSKFADLLDNSVISVLEKIAAVLFAICTTMSAIDTVISTISLVIGMISGACCPPTDPTAPARCAAQEGIFQSWSAIYAIVQPICCFVNCGWCTGDGNCFSILSGITLGAIPNIGIAGPGGGIAQFRLSPYDNIYLAIGCLCPIAIIFNLRKLKSIYDVYDCCIQEACENSLNTQACEDQLDEATCMYWEGSLYSMLANILLAIVISIIAKKLAELFGLSNLLACLYAVLKVAEVPRVIQGVMSAWAYMGKTFSKPNCKDLGFDKVKEKTNASMSEAAEEGFEDVDESLLENWEYVTLVDKNNDGVYDYSAPKWTLTNPDAKTSSEKIYTTTITSWQAQDFNNDGIKSAGEGKYTTTTYYKKGLTVYKDGLLTEKVGLLDWQKIKSSNTPTDLKIYPDSTASLGGTTGTYKIENGKIVYTTTITYLDKDKKTQTKTVTQEFTDPSVLGDAKIFGTDLKGSDFKRIEGNSLVSGDAGTANFRKLSFTENNQITLQAGTQSAVTIPPEVMSELKIKDLNWDKMSEKGGIWFNGNNEVRIFEGEYRVYVDNQPKARITQSTRPDGSSTNTYYEDKNGEWVPKTQSVAQTNEGYNLKIQKKWDSTSNKWVDEKVYFGKPGAEVQISQEVWSAYNPDQILDSGEAANIAEAYATLGDKGTLTQSSDTAYRVYSDQKDSQDKDYTVISVATTKGTSGESIESIANTYKDGNSVQLTRTFTSKYKVVMDYEYKDNEQVGTKSTTITPTGVVEEIGYTGRESPYYAKFDTTTGKMTSFSYENKVYSTDNDGALTSDLKLKVGSDNLDTRYYQGELQVKQDGEWKSASKLDNVDKTSKENAETTYKNADSTKKEVEKYAGAKTKQEQAKIEKEKKAAAKKETAAKKTKAQKEAEYQIAYRMMYDMIWGVFDLTLRGTVNSFIEDKCKSDSGKSYPPSETPTEGGGGEEAGPGGDTCGNSTTSVYNAQLISKTYLNTTCVYKASYSMKICTNSSMDYIVYLTGTSGDETIESGTLQPEQTISRNREIESAICTHDKICMQDTAGSQCYPP